MINRELNKREKEILAMIRPTTFHDVVEAVRKDVEYSRYDAKRELRNIKNGNGEILKERKDLGLVDKPCEVLA